MELVLLTMLKLEVRNKSQMSIDLSITFTLFRTREGIRCLDGPVIDTIEATALSFRNDYIDIYSSSWGPTDDGEFN